MTFEDLETVFAIKANNHEIKHLLPRTIFAHRHPSQKDVVLVSDSSKISTKDAIRLNVKQFDKIGNYYMNNPNRSLFLIYLSMLLDPSHNILRANSYVDGFLIKEAYNSNYTIDTEVIEQQPTHFINFWKGSAIEMDIQPTKDFSFRLTNSTANLIGLYEVDNKPITYNSKIDTNQEIERGQTVQVNYVLDTDLYTVIDV